LREWGRKQPAVRLFPRPHDSIWLITRLDLDDPLLLEDVPSE
jgi:hypothetical protein